MKIEITPAQALHLSLAFGETQPTPQEAINWLMANANAPHCSSAPDASEGRILAIITPPTYCPGCWYAQFPDIDFPKGFSSATCEAHAPKA